MKKRVCFFAGDITKSGGTERVAIQLANALNQDERYDIYFLSITEQAEKPFFPLDPEITRYQLKDNWITRAHEYIPLIGKLKKFLKEKQTDIIIDVDIVLDILSIPATRGLNTKVVSWEHFTADFELSVLYRKFILKYSVKRSDYIVVLTNGDLESYKNLLGRKSAISRIYNPVTYRFKDVEETERKNIILSVLRLVRAKGTEYIKETALKILKRNPTWQWIILGDGEERENLELFIEENNLQNQLILKGNVKNVDCYLKKASVFAVTSESEGLGLSILEAREMKVPCVAFDVKMGPRELIHDGTDGYLVTAFDCDKMAEKIQKLINDKSLREFFANNAFLCMEEFHIDKIVRQWEQILNLL